ALTRSHGARVATPYVSQVLTVLSRPAADVSTTRRAIAELEDIQSKLDAALERPATAGGSGALRATGALIGTAGVITAGAAFALGLSDDSDVSGTEALLLGVGAGGGLFVIGTLMYRAGGATERRARSSVAIAPALVPGGAGVAVAAD